jgi:hypothetical protein
MAKTWSKWLASVSFNLQLALGEYGGREPKIESNDYFLSWVKNKVKRIIGALKDESGSDKNTAKEAEKYCQSNTKRKRN